MAILIFIVMLLAVLYYRNYHGTTLVQSISNLQSYRVMAIGDKQHASDMIAHLDDFARSYIQNMKIKYGEVGNLDPLGYELVQNLSARYKGGNSLSENPPLNNETSYTLNKGDYITLCLRQKVPPYKLHSLEVLKYVFLHELTHVAMSMSDPGHSSNFWKQFKFILREATAQGMYVPIDYSAAHETYCGTEIKYNPYFDNNL